MGDERIIIGPGTNVWPHELKTAQALVQAGYTVEFVVRTEGHYAKSPDILINDVLWEMKAPKASNIKAIERNLKRARWQSPCIIFDSRRMKGIPDSAIKRELNKWSFEIQGIRHVLFVNRQGDVTEIR